MYKKAELLHMITVTLLENLKPGIYTEDPIPKPKFARRETLCFARIVVMLKMILRRKKGILRSS